MPGIMRSRRITQGGGSLVLRTRIASAPSWAPTAWNPSSVSDSTMISRADTSSSTTSTQWVSVEFIVRQNTTASGRAPHCHPALRREASEETRGARPGRRNPGEAAGRPVLHLDLDPVGGERIPHARRPFDDDDAPAGL